FIRTSFGRPQLPVIRSVMHRDGRARLFEAAGQGCLADPSWGGAATGDGELVWHLSGGVVERIVFTMAIYVPEHRGTWPGPAAAWALPSPFPRCAARYPQCQSRPCHLPIPRTCRRSGTGYAGTPVGRASRNRAPTTWSWRSVRSPPTRSSTPGPRGPW